MSTPDKETMDNLLAHEQTCRRISAEKGCLYPPEAESLYWLIDELRAANLRLREQLEWRPIETAPRDGKEIILAQPQYDPTKSFVGWWNKFENCWWDGLENSGIGYTPTGWLPMPATSKPASRTDGEGESDT